MKTLLLNRKGSNYIFVIVLVLLLSILAAGYSVALAYNARSSAEQRGYQQLTSLAKNMCQGVAESVSLGENKAANNLAQEATADYQKYLQALSDWGDVHIGLTPRFKDYVDDFYDVKGGATLQKTNGDLKVLMSYAPSYDDKCYLYITVEVTLDGKVHSVGAKIKAIRGEASEGDGVVQVAPIEEWKVEKYYDQ